MQTYNFEYERKIRAGFIGCGGHAFRNIYPTFQYAPVELCAVCDLRFDRAQAYARQFGAANAYGDHREMLSKETLDAVFIVTNYDEQGKPRFPKLAIDAMQAGCHAWIEKPPAGSVAEVREMMAVSQQTGKFVMVGFKKCFFPAIEKTKQIISTPEFGTPSALYIRYPQSLPPEADRHDSRKMVGFLDHIVHPGSIIHYLMGNIRHVYFEDEPFNRGSMGILRFESGAIGTLHLASGQSGTSPLERVEVIGQGNNVVVENSVKLTYYRRGGRGPGGYGRATTYIGPDDTAPIYWEPEFSLGQLYNKGIFLLGYAPEIVYFAECVLNNTSPTKCNLDTALELLKLFEAYQNPSGRVISLAE